MRTRLIFDYGVSREQACIMCHLSSECNQCCNSCSKRCNTRQTCSHLTRDNDGQRWEAWMHYVRVFRPDLIRFFSPKYAKLIKHKKT